MDWDGTLTVFLFIILLIGAASLSGLIFARWQSKETARDIEEGFEIIRRRLKGMM